MEFPTKIFPAGRRQIPRDKRVIAVFVQVRPGQVERVVLGRPPPGTIEVPLAGVNVPRETPYSRFRESSEAEAKLSPRAMTAQPALEVRLERLHSLHVEQVTRCRGASNL